MSNVTQQAQSGTNIEAAHRAALQQARQMGIEAAKAPFPEYTGQRVVPPGPGMQAAGQLATDPFNGRPLEEEYAPHQRIANERIQSSTTPFAQVAHNYMNPYQRHVLDEIQNRANRNWTENVLPSLEARFLKLGTVGGNEHKKHLERMQRDIAGETARQMGQFLHQGWHHGSQLHGSEMDRLQDAAKMQAALGQLAQSQRLANVDTLSRVGAQEQDLAQQAADFNYQQWLGKQRHKQEQANYLTSILSNIPYSSSSYNTQHQVRRQNAMRGSDWGQMAGEGLLGWMLR